MSQYPQPFESQSSGSIDLNIDELVLRGVPGRDRQKMVQEIEQELIRLLREGGLPSVSGALAGKQGPDSSRNDRASSKESLARQIARNVYQALGAG